MTELIHIRPPEATALSAVQKEDHLRARLAEIPSLIIALSGGADSAYLAWAAHKSLGARALSITALSPSYSAHDRAIVEELVSNIGFRPGPPRSGGAPGLAPASGSPPQQRRDSPSLARRRFAHLGPPFLRLLGFSFALRHGSDPRASWPGRARRSRTAPAGFPPIPG